MATNLNSPTHPVRMVLMRIKSVVSLAAATVLALSACGQADSSDKLAVTTSFYPLTYIVQQIGGDAVEVTDLTPPGADAHGVELSPREVADLEKSDLVLYVKTLSPAIDNAIDAAELGALDIGESVDLLSYKDIEQGVMLGDDDDADADHHEDTDGEHHEDGDHHDHEGGEHHHGTHDPHFWTDPSRMMEAADVVATKLQELDPDNAETYSANLATLREDLQGLADDIAKLDPAQCRTDSFVVTHMAFSYLAQNAGLHQIGIAGFDPEIEPSPARVREIAQAAKELDINTVFATSDAEVKSANAIATEAGMDVQILDPAATQRDPELDYVEVMRHNIQLLRDSLGC